ncbi:MAG: hypothetical protein JO111_08220 [Caulobacteraceae bacterium]|nr:hypothetical protein [Caulobacteraceae bacterium]
MSETSTLKRATCVAGLDNGYLDELCLAEIVEVLDRYGRRDRFGVFLLDPPFPVSDEEVLVESCDSANRTLTLRPVTKGDLDGVRYITTRWRLDADSPEPACVRLHMGETV